MRAMAISFNPVGVGFILLTVDAGCWVSGFSLRNQRLPKAPTSLSASTIDGGSSFEVFYAADDSSAKRHEVGPDPDNAGDDARGTSLALSTAGRTKDGISGSGLAWAAIGAILTVSLAANVQLADTLSRAFDSIFAWYMTRLELAPLATKCITGGIVALIGDCGAQWFERRPPRSQSNGLSRVSPSEPALSVRAGADHDRPKKGWLPTRGAYDVRRGAARFLECLLVSSPLMHYGYDLFESILPVTASGAGGARRSLAALSHVLADCVLLDGIFVGTGILATSLLEGHSLRRYVLPHLRRVYLPTLRASIATSGALVPLQFLSFRFLPVQLRVLSVNAVDLIWTAVVSFVSHGGGEKGSHA